MRWSNMYRFVAKLGISYRLVVYYDTGIDSVHSCSYVH